MKTLKLSQKYKTVICCGLLLFIPLIDLSFFSFPEDARYYIPFLEEGTNAVTLNPSEQVNKDLQWMVSLGADRLICIVYLVCFLVRPSFKLGSFNLWYVYLFNESSRLINHFLTYENWKFANNIMPFVLIITPILFVIFYLSKSE